MLQSHHTTVPLELQLCRSQGATLPSRNKPLDLCNGIQEYQRDTAMRSIGTYKGHFALLKLCLAPNQLGSKGYLAKYNGGIYVRCDLRTTAGDTDSAAQTSHTCLALVTVTASPT
jgi:hypothetical protein